MDISHSFEKITMVFGASSNPSRYSNLAIISLLENKHKVIAIGNKKGVINHVEIKQIPPTNVKVDTVSLYLNRINQQIYYAYILKLHPRRIIFNPGAENEEFFKLAVSKGIYALNACTLVMLATNQY